MLIEIAVSVGELVDKITILQIKQINLKDVNQLDNVNRELNLLNQKLDNLQIDTPEFRNLVDQLKSINTALWDIENIKRNFENTQIFDASFIEISREVHFKNDLRAQIKRKINILTGSTIVEEKEYTQYD